MRYRRSPARRRAPARGRRSYGYAPRRRRSATTGRRRIGYRM